MSDSNYGLSQRIGYALCNAGISIGGIPTNLLLLYYLTQIVGIRAGLAGLALAIPKVWDALVDPMLGGWVDALTLRLGTRTPIILVAGAGYLATLIGLFSLPPADAPMAVLVLAILLSILSSIAQTVLGVTQYALATDMSRDSVGLSQLMSLASVLAQILTVVGSIVVPLMIVWSGSGRVGYARMATEVAAVAGLALLVFTFAMRRVPVRTRSATQKTLPLLASLRATTANRPFYLLIAFVICQNASIVILTSFLPFANEYVLGGSAHSLSILEGVVGATVLAGMALAPQFVRRFGTIGAMRACNLLAACALLGAFAASFVPVWTTWLMCAALGFGWGIIGILIQTALLEAARRQPAAGNVVAIGFYLGIVMAGIKLGNSAGGIIAGVYLDAIAFVPGAAGQSAGTLSGLRAGYSMLPLLLVLVSALFLRRGVLKWDEGPQPTVARA
jgi:GPH family glycoside/pentoside/hexuronide:cation symporter